DLLGSSLRKVFLLLRVIEEEVGMSYNERFMALFIHEMDLEAKVMDISIILVSSYSSEESVGILAGRVILFGSIPTHILDNTSTVTLLATHLDTTLIPAEIPTISPIIPPFPDYTPASPDYSLHLIQRLIH
nr:hypothetical protein [Tanacetum cinerariifolium]